MTQTVTQTRKNQVELSVLETTKLRNFLSRKVRKCLEMSAKNIRPTFGTKRPRVRIPTLRPNPAEIFRFQPDFSAYSELFPMENSAHFPFDPNVTQTEIRSGKHRKINFAACRSFSGRRHSHFSLFSSDACHEAADFLCGFFSIFFNLSHTSESRHSSNTWYISLPLICSIKALLLAVKSYCSFV